MRFTVRRALTLLLILSPSALMAEEQFPAERPGTSVSDSSVQRDLTGLSIKTRRVRAIHTEDSALTGGTAYLFWRDPWLGYQRGRELFLREFTPSDGVYGGHGKNGGPPLEDGITRIMTGSHATSCALCHNTPFRDGGSGATIFKNGGRGRNTPHLFGAGLIEMLGWQIRLKLLALADTNRNGFIDRGESEKVRAVLKNIPDGIPGEQFPIDFGCFGDADGDGVPDLNPVCNIWYVDAEGRRLPGATSLHDSDVAGYNFEVQVFGWGHGEKGAGRVALSSTLRGFSAGAFHLHSGLQPVDPTLAREPGRDGLARISLAGAQQFFTAKPLDRAQARDANGVSLDDPDKDGIREELSEGDMDLCELYQLNHPAPAETFRTVPRERGRAAFGRIGCTRCHVPDWHLEVANTDAADYTQRFTGDRRFFNLLVEPDSTRHKLEGKLHLLTRKEGGDMKPRREAFTIRGVYSDFAYHDLGSKFHQIQFDGTVIRRFKTAPLWGIGSTSPYGHDGASLDLEDVIRRHGGEASSEIAAYESLPEEERESLLAFLRGLVLYSVDQVPCDVDGDGRIETHFMVSGQDTGVERLNPEWLFRTPGHIEGRIRNPSGNWIT